MTLAKNGTKKQRFAPCLFVLPGIPSGFGLHFETLCNPLQLRSLCRHFFPAPGIPLQSLASASRFRVQNAQSPRGFHISNGEQSVLREKGL
jgi:hypothetical protein